MKSIRAAVALFLVAVFLAGVAYATTSSINPNVPAQNSPLSSSVLRGNFGDAYNDINTLFGIDTLSSNQLLGTVNAGMAGPLNLPSCPLGGLSWTPGTGFGCTNIAGIVSPVTNALVFTGAFAVNYNAVTLPTKQTGTVIQFGDADSVTSRLEGDSFAAPVHFTGVRADGTNAAPTTLQSGDEIASFNAFGYNGSATVGPKAAFRTYASQNWTGSANGTYADIATTLAGTTTMAQVIKFENDGGIDTPGVTGGDCGAGCINVGAVKVNNVPVLTANQAITLSGDASGTGTTAITVTNNKVNGVSYPASPSTSTVPVVTGSNAISYEVVPLAAGGTNGSTAAAALSNIAGNPSGGTYSIYCTSGLSCTTTAASSGGGGSGTVNSGTATNFAYYASSGTAVSTDANLTDTGSVIGLAEPEVITSNSANALAVGPNGLTTPIFAVNDATSSAVNGLQVTGAATGGVVTVGTTGTNAGLTLTSTGSGNVVLNSTSGTLRLEVASNPYLGLGTVSGGIGITPLGNAGATNIPFEFTPPATTGLTASTNAIVGEWLSATRQHSTGALTLQEDYLINGVTDGFVGGSTLTTGATWSVLPKSCGTNGTCTNEYALYVPSTSVSGTVSNTYAAGLFAATGGTNNYAANFGGDVIFSGTAPVVSSCGSGSLATGSTDHKGQITGVTTATSCTITFGQGPLGTAPACHVMGGTSGALSGAYISAISTSAVTFTFSSFSGTLYYLCF